MVKDISPDQLSEVVKIASGLVAAGNRGRSERGLTDQLAEGLVLAGVPLDRLTSASEVLDPVVGSRSYIWTNVGNEGSIEPIRRERTANRSEDYYKSTLYWMVSRNEPKLRIDLNSEFAEQFPFMIELRQRGFTDYYGRIEAFGERAQIAGTRGLLSSFATKRQGGFSNEHIALIDAVLPAFALAFLSRLNSRILSRTLATYLGRTPAENVLKGQITRGEPQTLDAVIWMSDLQGFTKISDNLPKDALLEFLNAHAEIVAKAVEAEGGEILKFIGDGVLAVFDGTRCRSCAAGAALTAALNVEEEIRRARVDRTQKGLETADVVTALHQGSVLFGNFGSPSRLDFTALGPAVNEASRICSLAKTLDQTIIGTEDFIGAMESNQNAMVSLGRYALRGIGQPRHLYTVDRALMPRPEAPPPQ